MAIPSYRASLKNPDVEEVIDLVLHRPLGYLVARAAYPTPISADLLTIVSMLLGIASGALIYAMVAGAPRSFHVWAAVLLVASAVFDCSDGQLARMRQRATRYGRMLDGAVDAIVQVAVVPAAVVHMAYRRGGLFSPGTLAWVIAAALALFVGVRHTTLYDHFKNVYTRNTEPAPKDCDDLEDVEAEWARIRAEGGGTWFNTFRYRFYLLHLQLVRQTMRVLDPYIPARFGAMPPYSEERASRYKTEHRALMRGWSFFGIGTHIFTFALSVAMDRLEWYVVLRLVGFNLLLAALLPAQRRASRAFFGTGAAP